mmetsp:Transcript_22071/g.44261  ORF Transcript_22071/g.44261 Transcript_22071/m.44261 type:complete len:100 (+) Transcript_22071:125-424(+)
MVKFQVCIDDNNGMPKITVERGVFMPVCEWVAINPKIRCESNCPCKDPRPLKNFCRKTCDMCTRIQSPKSIKIKSIDTQLAVQSIGWYTRLRGLEILSF